MSKLLRTLALAGFFAPALAQASFADVSADHANSAAINYVQSENIVSGYADGTYKPDRTINRAEFTKIIVAASLNTDRLSFCFAENPLSARFSDVDRSQWYAPYLCLAHLQSFIAGYNDGTFRPNQPVTFVEAAKIITKGFGMDSATTNLWYEGYVRSLESKSAIPVSVTSFEKQLTRGEMAEIIYRLKANITNKPTQAFATLSGKTSQNTGNLSFTDPLKKYTISYPNSWTVENLGLDGIKFTYPKADLYAHASFVSQAYLQASVERECPEVHDTFGTPIEKVTLGNRTFTAVHTIEAAAGTKYNTVTYTYQLNLDQCLVIQKILAVSSGAIDNAQEQALADSQQASVDEAVMKVLKTISVK